MAKILVVEVDRSVAEMDYDFLLCSEYMETVTCSSRYASVCPDPKTGCVYGQAKFQLQNTSRQEQNAQFQINPGYKVTSIRANGADAPFFVDSYQAMGEKMFTVTLPADPEIELVIDYGGFSQERNINAIAQGSTEVSDMYMCLENHALSPAPFDVLYTGKTLPAVMDIVLPGHITPVLFGSGTTELLKENGDGTKTWRMTDEGYSMILYAGDYIREEIPVENAGITVNFYYSRKHHPIMEAMDAVETIRQTVKFCTEYIGFLSFYGDGSFNLIESRCRGGGYAGDGASLADELDFTADNLANGAKGGSSAQVTIHELVHQWWGLGNMFDPMDEESPWSSEGLTCYTTYRIVKELYGEAEAQANFVDAWQKAMDEILQGLFSRELNLEYPYLSYQEFLDACHLTEEDLNLE